MDGNNDTTLVIDYDFDKENQPLNRHYQRPYLGEEEARRWQALMFKIHNLIQALMHSRQCHSNCDLPSCRQMKKIIEHTMNCRIRYTSRICRVCRQFIIILCYHSKYCPNTQCAVPVCNQIKNGVLGRVMRQRDQERLRRHQLQQHT